MKKSKYFISVFLIGIGISMFFYPKISNFLAEENQMEMIKQYKQTISNVDESEISVEYEKAKIYNQNISNQSFTLATDEKLSSSYEEILNISHNGIMSYIEIPKIGAYLPIYHGTADEQMKKGVGHLENTSLPIGGENNHCVLTGHTGLLRAEIFTRLTEVETNDYFYIYTLEKKLIYKVYQIKVVLPTETKDLEIVEGKDLVTLITCTPYGVNTHRLLVQGERVEEVEDTEGKLESDRNFEENRLYFYPKNHYDLIGILFGAIVLFIIFCFLIWVKFFKN